MTPTTDPASTDDRNVRDALAALAGKASEGHRLSVTDFDWTRRPVLPLIPSRKLFVRALSQFFHGERFAKCACHALLPRLAEPEARLCLEIQADDEARHAEIYRSYLERIGGVAPPEPPLARAAEAALAWRGAPEALILACHVLLESDALRLDRSVAGWSRCPLFQDISARIGRDEARHVAFGSIYLRGSLDALPLTERLVIHEWLRSLWCIAAAGIFDRFTWATLPSHWRAGAVETRWSKRARDLQAAGLFSAQETDLFLRP